MISAVIFKELSYSADNFFRTAGWSRLSIICRMLASKRVRKQSTKYSDFVKIPIKKRKKVVNDEANGTNNQVLFVK